MSRESAALLVSVVSLVLAAFAVGWNVYRDVVLKATLKVRVGIATVMTQGSSHSQSYVNITGTNFGPGVLTVNMIWGRSTTLIQRLFGKRTHFVVLTDGSNPLSTRLPARIEVGEKVEILLPYVHDCFLHDRVTKIGLTDSFGRRHSAPAKEIRAARKQYLQDFPKTSV